MLFIVITVLHIKNIIWSNSESISLNIKTECQTKEFNLRSNITLEVVFDDVFRNKKDF